jgi:hypothetical protein
VVAGQLLTGLLVVIQSSMLLDIIGVARSLILIIGQSGIHVGKAAQQKRVMDISIEGVKAILGRLKWAIMFLSIF